MNLQVKKLNEKSKLDKKVNPDDLIYRYKGNIADVKFDEFDIAVDLIDQIKMVK